MGDRAMAARFVADNPALAASILVFVRGHLRLRFLWDTVILTLSCFVYLARRVDSCLLESGWTMLFSNSLFPRQFTWLGFLQTTQNDQIKRATCAPGFVCTSAHAGSDSHFV